MQSRNKILARIILPEIPRAELFYKNHNRKDEDERISLNHRKIPTLYYSPKYDNIISVKLLSALSAETDSKYLTTSFQQRFVPAPGACITFKPKHNFAAYLSFLCVSQTV